MNNDVIVTETLPAGTGRPFRLGIIADDYAQPYSFMRVAGPFETMAREDRRLEILRPTRGEDGGLQHSWDWLLQCDAVFMYHPLADKHIHSLALARRMGIPVWVEFTDDPFSVPPTSPIYQVFKDKKFVRENVTSALDLANVVTVTSQTLKDALVTACDLDSTTRPSLFPQRGKPSDKILILPEACFFPASDLPRKRVVSWRGLGTHDEDTAGVLPQVCAVAKMMPNWEWALFGNPHRDFVEQLEAAAGVERVKVSPFWPTPIDMVEAWRGCAPYLHLVPLADDAFNRSKSHLAWLEATAVGAAVLVPDYLPEWQQPGVIPYAAGSIVAPGKVDFMTVLLREMATFQEGAFHPDVRTARAAVYPDRTVLARNQLRWAVVRKLLKIVSGESRVGSSEEGKAAA